MSRGKMSRRALLAGPLLLVACSGCLTFSSFRTARIAEPGRPQATIAITRNDYPEDSGDDTGWSGLELRGRSCLQRDRLEGHLKMSLLEADKGSMGAVLGGGLKASLLRDYLAVDLPLSWLVGDASTRLLQLHPGLIATLPLRPGLDLNADGEVYVSPQAGVRSMYAWHLGLAAGPADRRWAVRPEIGWIAWDGEDRRYSYMQFGVAIEFAESGRPPDSGQHHQDRLR